MSGCHPPEPGKSLLILKNRSSDSADKLVWKWRNSGGPVTIGDLGDPTATTDYALCLYAGGSTISLAIPAGSQWHLKGAFKGYKFVDLSRLPDGVSKAKVTTGSGDVPLAMVKGGGVNLPDALVPPLPLPVIAQMVNSHGVCFSAFYDAGTVIRNDMKQFKAKATAASALP